MAGVKRVLVDGAAEGPCLHLSRPICFWGGLDPETGRIADPAHPEHGEAVAGRVLAIPRIVGSSSSSQQLLECMRRGIGPAAIILGAEEVILAGAVLVSREMGWGTIPVMIADLGGLRTGSVVRISEGGQISA